MSFWFAFVFAINEKPNQPKTQILSHYKKLKNGAAQNFKFKNIIINYH